MREILQSILRTLLALKKYKYPIEVNPIDVHTLMRGGGTVSACPRKVHRPKYFPVHSLGINQAALPTAHLHTEYVHTVYLRHTCIQRM